MSNIGDYLEERLRVVEEQTNALLEKKKALKDEIQSIEEKQKKFTEKIDMTYELFSPKPLNVSDHKESVQILEVNKYELMSKKNLLDTQIEKLSDEKKKIEESMTDLRRMENCIKKIVEQYHLTDLL